MSRQRQRDKDAAETTDAQAPESKVSRREGMASIARRRAAHFAHFTADDAQEGDNVHVGGDQASTLGPWSSAVELVNARGKAAAERSNKILHARRQADTGEGATITEWLPSRDTNKGVRVECVVPSLFDTCVGLLCEYIDCVESLWGVPDSIKVKIAKAVTEQGKLSPEVARLFASGNPSEVVLDTCSQLEQPAMMELLEECSTSRLERLELGFCGRGLGDEAAKAVGRVGRLAALETLKVGGAYRLSDVGAEALVGVANNLTSLSFTDCPKFTGAVLEKLPQLTPQLRRLELKDCRFVNMDCLSAALPHLTHLQALSLDGMGQEVDDGVVMEVARISSLRDLNLSKCTRVGDDGLVCLCAKLPGLRSLLLDDCTQITDRSLHAIAGALKELQVLSVHRCFRLTDTGLAAVAELGTLQRCIFSNLSQVGAGVINALGLHCCATLELLDISFCRGAPENAVGSLVDRCQRLRKLVVFGCSQLSHKFFAGHSNDDVEVVGMGTVHGG